MYPAPCAEVVDEADQGGLTPARIADVMIGLPANQPDKIVRATGRQAGRYGDRPIRREIVRVQVGKILGAGKPTGAIAGNGAIVGFGHMQMADKRQRQPVLQWCAFGVVKADRWYPH